MARFVPIVIQLQGAQQGTAQVQGFAQAFDSLDTSADRAGSHGLRNSLVAAELFADAIREGLRWIKEAIVDTTLFAGRTEELQIALEQLARVNNISNSTIRAQQLSLHDLNISTQEGLTVLSAMIGAQLDVSKASALATTAQDLAVVAGKNSSETMLELVQAIQLGRTEAFRAAGAFINVDEALTKGSRTLGLTKDALNDTQRQQILLNAVIEYGARQVGTYDAAMGSFYKQLLSTQRLADDAKESIGGLFQAPAALGLKGLQFVLEIIAKYPGSFALATAAVLLFIAAMNADSILRMWQAIQSIIASVRLLGAVMAGTAEVTAATSIAATAGWGALAIAVIAAGAALYSYISASEELKGADERRTNQLIAVIKANQEDIKWLQESASALKSDADSRGRIEQAISRLDPIERAHIATIQDETAKRTALAQALDKNNEARNRELILQAQAAVIAGSVEANTVAAQIARQRELNDLIDQIEQGKQQRFVLSGATQGGEIVRKDLLEAARLELLSIGEAVGKGNEKFEQQAQLLARLQREFPNNTAAAHELAAAHVELQNRVAQINLDFAENERRLRSLSGAWQQYKDSLKIPGRDFAASSEGFGLSAESTFTRLASDIKELQEKGKDAGTALHDAVQLNAKALLALDEQAKNSFGSQSAYRQWFRALPEDEQKAIRLAAGMKAASVGIKTVSESAEEASKRWRELTTQLTQLRNEVAALQKGGGKLFALEVEKSDLEATKSEYTEILKLRHQLQMPMGAPIPAEQAARQAELREDQRKLQTRHEILKLSESDLDNAERLKVMDYQSNEALLTTVGFDEKHAKALETLVALKRADLDLSTQVLDARAKTKAIEELLASRRGRPTLGGKTESLGLVQSIAEQAALFNESTAQATLTAARSYDSERERQRQLTGDFYLESKLRGRIVEEEQTGRLKATNDATEEIRRIEDRLGHDLISNELVLDLARHRAAEERRKQAQQSYVDFKLIYDQLDRLSSGDKETIAIATNDYLKTFYTSMVGVRTELIAIKDLGGIGAIVGSADFSKALKEKFDLNQLHSVIDLNTQIAQSEYNIGHASELSALQYRLAWTKAEEDVAGAAQKAAEQRAADLVKLRHQMDLDYSQLDDGLIHFLAEQKTLQQTFEDARTNAVKAWFDGVDSAIDKMTKRLGAAGTVVNQFLKDLAHIAESQILQKLLGIGTQPGGTPTFAGGVSTQNAGGILGFFRNLLGLGANQPATNPAALVGGGTFANGGNFVTGGYAGGSGAASYLQNVTLQNSIAAQTRQFFSGVNGNGITPPSSTLGTQVANQAVLSQILNEGPTSRSAPQIGSSASSAGFAEIAPLLGLTLGASAGSRLGGPSRLGNVLGAVGGGALGLLGGITLPSILAGEFAGFTALGFATLGIGAAALIAAVLIGISAKRRKNEEDRASLNSDTYTAVIQVLNDARAGKYDSAGAALADFDKIKSNYFSRISGYDSKTKRIATDAWNDTKNGFEYYRPLIQQAAQAASDAKGRAGKLAPEFADGGDVSRAFALSSTYGPMIHNMRHLQYADGGFHGRVPGVYDRRDNHLIAVSGDEVVLTPNQWKPITNYLKAVRVPGFADGGAGAKVAPSIASTSDSGTIEISVAAIKIDAEGIVFEGLKSSDNRKVIFKDVMGKILSR